jgi:hypothetical protein
MSWKIYKLIYLAPGPVHAGFREIGNVVRTRYYIPASTIWGAVTANLTRAIFPNGHQRMAWQYHIVGNYVKEYLRFGYFFPAEGSDISMTVYRPKIEPAGERYGNLKRDQFERKFITSITTTALEVSAENGLTPKQTFAAEEGSLHEMEIITAKQTPGNGWAKLKFFGYAYFKSERTFVSPDPELEVLKNLENDDYVLTQIKQIIVGGERKYGFGKLVKQKDDDFIFLKETVDLIPEELNQPDTNSDIFFASHVPVISGNNFKIKGTVEPYVCRIWGDEASQPKTGPGQVHSKAQICWIPGTKCNSTYKKLMRIGPGGMWHIQLA